MTHRSRDRFESASSLEMKALTERLDNLRAVAERVPGDQKFLLERSLDELRGLRNRCEARLEDARRASEDAWYLVKVHAEAALAQFRAGIETIENQYRRMAA
ncbi:hypothetical protein JL100_019380 [Skermanella mucosa]|uniref:hypothetical protein n=1 Tax=Skermanella mucosa TaxID=1789672 RepID=UPI00192BAB43|nr:hypothetical protein [Skermanella mucosa]UEM19247.1 hypothetical protein JL100_019380 [Skermanella mucosa]